MAVLIALLFALWFVLQRTVLTNSDDVGVILGLAVLWAAVVSILVSIPSSPSFSDGSKILYSDVLAIALVMVGGAFFQFAVPRLGIIPVERDAENKIGFSVITKNKSITGARIICDGVKQRWDVDGKEEERADLDVGDLPTFTFPYEAITASPSVSDTTLRNPMTIEMIIQHRRDKDVNGNGKIVCSSKTTIPRGATGKFSNAISPMHFTSKIRLVGSRFEKETDYHFQLGVENVVVIGTKKDSTQFTYKFQGKFVLTERKKWWHFW
jgi:hypothetical protein